MDFSIRSAGINSTFAIAASIFAVFAFSIRSFKAATL